MIDKVLPRWTNLDASSLVHFVVHLKIGSFKDVDDWLHKQVPNNFED